MHADELLYSACARYHILSGNTTYKQTQSDLFDTPEGHSSVLLPIRAKELYERIQHADVHFDEFFNDHTALPYILSFFPKDRRKHILSIVHQDNNSSLPRELGYGILMQFTKPKLCFCPQCYAVELQRYGYGYWHRLHQMPGVLVCEKHHVLLLESNVSALAHGGSAYIAPDLYSLFPAMIPTPLSAIGLQQAIWLAQDTVWLYANTDRVQKAFEMHGGDFHVVFLRLLQQKKYVSQTGFLKISKFQHAFLSYYDGKLLRLVGLRYEDAEQEAWITKMCRGDKKKEIPLKYIVLARFACGGIQNLIEAAEKSTPEMLAYGHPAYIALPEHDEKLQSYRARWLDACDKMPGANQNAIRKTVPAVYTWLIRHDNAWVKEHPKERASKGVNHGAYDWHKRDQELVRLVPKAAEKIRSRPGKPVRATKHKILIEIGHGSMNKRTEKMLPLTMQAIAEFAEGIIEFRMREIAWAERELTQENAYTVWKIKRKTGISDDVWEESWRLYCMRKERNRECDVMV